MRFEFATATRVVFGPGALNEVAPLAAGMGSMALVVTGRSAERAQPLVQDLVENGVDTVTFPVSGEPTTDMVRSGSEQALASGCDLVIALGGGSALDGGKAIAALVTNGCDPYEYLEVIGQGKALTEPPLPFIAIPTTAGTGAEVTRNSVLYAPEHKMKVSLRSPLMLPRLAVVDPELTYGLPPAVTASTGLDALTQVLEPYVSKMANPMTDAFCREGLRRVARSLRRACEQGNDAAAREDMALTSLLGGLALANARLGAVHGFAGLIGGMFPAPHGAICARLLPGVMAVNVRALQARQPESDALRRYDEVAKLLAENEFAVAADGVDWVQSLVRTLDVPPLSSYGMTADDFPSLVEKVANTSSMKGNPIELMSSELEEILARAL